jgi:hypothetical protein
MGRDIRLFDDRERLAEFHRLRILDEDPSHVPRGAR